MDIDYTDPGLQAFIIQRCEEEREGNVNVISPHTSTNCVVRLADKVAVKFGTGVTEAEADALTFASRNLDRAIIKVPSVFQYFTRPDSIWTTGYLVMELVEGASLERLPPAEGVQHVAPIMRAVQHIHGFCGARPGPLDGSRTRGLVFGESGIGPPLNSRDHLQKFFDFMMEKAKADITVDATNMPLSLCHLDIHPHNFIVAPDQSIYLLDWRCAGFYPAAFETWSILSENLVRKNTFMYALGQHLASCTSPAEMALAETLVRANLEHRNRARKIPDPGNMNFPPLAQRESGPPTNRFLVDLFGNDVNPSGSSDPTSVLRRILSAEPLPPDIAAASRASGRQEGPSDIITRMLMAEGFGRGNGPSPGPPEMRGPLPPPPPGMGPRN